MPWPGCCGPGGDAGAAATIIKAIWREEDLTPYNEMLIPHDFGDSIDKTDRKFRADRLLYKEQVAAAMREAAAVGPDYVLLAKARAAVIANALSDGAIAAVPKALQADPGLVYAKVQRARRANRVDEAAALLLSAPRDTVELVDGDAWVGRAPARGEEAARPRRRPQGLSGSPRSTAPNRAS